MTTHWLVPRRPRRVTRPAFSDLRSFDDLFEEVWRGLGAARQPVGSYGDFAPRMDLAETEEELRISAELPGLEEKDFEVTLEEGVLSIKGERRSESEEEEKNYRHLESVRGSFHRAIRLPCEVDAEGVKARYERGVLTVSLPKVAEVRPEVRHIPISTG